MGGGDRLLSLAMGAVRPWHVAVLCLLAIIAIMGTLIGVVISRWRR